jgi:hypothetical protein
LIVEKPGGNGGRQVVWLPILWAGPARRIDSEHAPGTRQFGFLTPLAWRQGSVAAMTVLTHLVTPLTLAA